MIRRYAAVVYESLFQKNETGRSLFELRPHFFLTKEMGALPRDVFLIRDGDAVILHCRSE